MSDKFVIRQTNRVGLAGVGWRAVAALSSGERTAMILYYRQDMSVGEHVSAIVMARIERDVDRKADAPVVPVRHREYPAWVWTLAGAAMVFGAAIYGWYATGSMPDVASSRIGPGRPALMPTAGSGAVILALGLLLYIVGLLAPLRSDKA